MVQSSLKWLKFVRSGARMATGILKSVDRQFRPYFEELLGKGWTIEIGKKCVKLRSAKGGLVTCSKTPSCPYALKHIKGDVNRLLRKEASNEAQSNGRRL